MANEVLGTAVAGLDYLEVAGLTPEPSRDLRQGSGKVWATLWPKLLGLALVLAIWEVVYLSGWKSTAVLPAPGVTLANLWDQAHHYLLWQAIGTTLRRAVIGFALALVIGSAVGAV